MSTYDWLLFLHLLGAVAVFAAVAIYTGVLFGTNRGGAEGGVSLRPLVRVGGILYDVGGGLLLVFGIWLAFEADYGITDEWILAALAVFIVAAYAGTRTRVRLLAGARAVGMYALAVVAVLVLLALMIFKPGAG